MSKSLNKVQLIGTIGRDAESSHTPNGKMVSKLSIATESGWKDQSGEWKTQTNWTNCVLWGQEGVVPYLLKGGKVYLEGRLQTRSYEDKDGKKIYTTEVVVENVILLGSKAQAASSGGSGDNYSNAATDEDAPF